MTARAPGFDVLRVLLFGALASCSTAAPAVGEGQPCSVTTDCQVPLVCITQPSGMRTCGGVDELVLIQQIEEAGTPAMPPGDAEAPNGEPDAEPTPPGADAGASGQPDATVDAGGSALPGNDAGSPPGDAGPSADASSSPPVDAGAAPEASTTEDDATTSGTNPPQDDASSSSGDDAE